MGWMKYLIGGGLGYLFGGPIGSIIGLAIGSMMDRAEKTGNYPRDLGMGRESLQLAFFTAIFSLLAKVARADGRISQKEGDHFLSILDSMGLHLDLREFAIHTFNEAKNSSYSHSEFARQLRQIAQASQGQAAQAILQQFFYQLVSMAAVDGHLSTAEDVLLREIAYEFAFSETLIDQAYSQFDLHNRNSCYTILGLKPDASDEEVRHTYRKLVKETHPDTLIRQGLPPEMKESAEKRFHEIQKAWEQIKKERGLN